MTTAHTPGPWRAYFYEKNQRFHTGKWIWLTPDPKFPGHETIVNVEARNGIGEANARLIAAAPELLTALQAILPHAWGHSKAGCKGKVRDPENCDVCKAIWAARDAIAKATGEKGI